MSLYDGANVVVTGGAGFIGSALVRELVKENAHVTVVDNLFSGKKEFLAEVMGSIDFHETDILSPEFEKLLQRLGADYVFNLAALPYIPDSYLNPRSFFDVNSMGCLKVLLACKEAGVERVMQYSTSEVYGTAQRTPMDEHHPLNPLSTYAVSKVAADRLCYTLHYEGEVPVIILRQFNVFGPRETHPYIIPEIISQLSRTSSLRLGNVNARRDLTYVEDAARAAMLLMLQKNAVGQVFNSGTGIDHSVREMAEQIASAMGVENMRIQLDESRLRPLDVERLQANYFKLAQMTGWHPKTSFEHGIRKTVEWFNDNGKKWPWQ
ncbi:MAG: GDP-mannose 4,6-dehydratase [Candidatus Diapherotrites archaeon]|uniref:GDP-mannose 4,6-dehydratase n=1 Tax=Candidatus Iainarchaeum sp. TaxID=3101447 RepID=A0A8T3YI60_9ARCH|nr:GDP-mannose 4,6-dehydratase [Candidatus Diapherotrites archaeon]